MTKLVAAALIRAKVNFPPIYKTSSNPHFKSKYAPLDAILEAIDAPLSQAGLVLIQPTIIRDGVTILSTQLIHAESGDSIASELVIPTQSDPQKLGAALTYYRRFSICSLLAIAAEADDDGAAAVSSSQTKQPVDRIAEKRQAVKDCMTELEWDEDRKSQWAKSIDSLPYAQWSLKSWELALVKAHAELDKINQ